MRYYSDNETNYSRFDRDQEHEPKRTWGMGRGQRSHQQPRNDYYRNEFSHRRDEFIRGDEEGYVQPHYRSQESDRRPSGRYTEDDLYKGMYDMANYDAQPRRSDYGHNGRDAQGYGDQVRPYPRNDNPMWEDRSHRRYSMGYNPNYDNPEEGDMYRNFDSRGNHGYRHDASYGSTDQFRDFSNDRYGESYDHRSRRNNRDEGYYR